MLVVRSSAVLVMLLQRLRQLCVVALASWLSCPGLNASPILQLQCLWILVESLQVPLPMVTQSGHIRSSPFSRYGSLSVQLQ